MSNGKNINQRLLQQSSTFDSQIIDDIQSKAELGRYRMRGYGTLRQRTWAAGTRRERCSS